MSTCDYEIHLGLDHLNLLWGGIDSESEGFPFGEDSEDIDRIIEEELGPPRRRRGARKTSRA